LIGAVSWQALSKVFSIHTASLLLQGLPDRLLPYLRLAHSTEASDLRGDDVLGHAAGPLSPANERAVLHQLLTYFEERLKG
jgi:Rubisco LSMT substrate-binding